MVAPLQDRLHRMAVCVAAGEEVLTRGRIEDALGALQDGDGALMWRALEAEDPLWLERAWANLAALRLAA